MPCQNEHMRKPRIAMTTWRRTMPTFISEHTDLYTLGTEYPGAVAAAGGLPLLLPHHHADDAPRVLEGFDGLVMVGGDDVDPLQYGQADHGCNKGVSASADESDISLARAALELGIPVFAICRGCQVLNVALGGTLHQDMTSADGPHRPISDLPDEVMGARHAITIEPGSRLAKAYGSTEHLVNSIHHQAIDRVAPGFRAVAWAPDGIVEAIEPIGDHRVLAVQWHPEKIVNEGDHVLFEHFVREMVG
jgi:putative glutamine amidotransferase